MSTPEILPHLNLSQLTKAERQVFDSADSIIQTYLTDPTLIFDIRIVNPYPPKELILRILNLYDTGHYRIVMDIRYLSSTSKFTAALQLACAYINRNPDKPLEIVSEEAVAKAEAALG